MSDYKVQANATIGGVLFNVNGDDVDEVMVHLTALSSKSTDVFDLFSSVEQAARASSVLKAPVEKPTPEVATNKSEPPPWNGDVQKCACGIPMNDVRGLVYKSGAKEGQPYPNDFYAAKDCKNKCKPIKL
jgi:hypothetical protein